MLISTAVNPREVLREIGVGDELTENALNVFLRRMLDLWNLTPREEFHGLSPNDLIDLEDSEPNIKAEYKVGRNEPCPCGSGVKYKKCHGASVVL